MATKTTKISASDSSKGKPWVFPKQTLEEAIEVLKAIDEKNAGNPMHSSDLSKALGFPSIDWPKTFIFQR